jgi:hypothetical protein
MKIDPKSKSAVMTIIVASALLLGINSSNSADSFGKLAYGAHRSGIVGQVFLQAFPNAATPYYEAELLFYAKRGNHYHLADRLTTAADGTFQVTLPPGTYIIAPPPEGEIFGSLFTPITVSVEAKTETSISIVVEISDIGF